MNRQRPPVPEGGIPLPVPSLHPRTLWLRRYPPEGAVKGALLLLHGGNSSGDVFLAPEGGVVRHLCRAGWEVWILEWRASPYVVDDVLRHDAIGGSADAERRRYTFDQAAAEDIPQALHYINANTGAGRALAIVGHCLGSGMAALSCARGFLEEFQLRTLVLCELALFVEVPWNGWVKPEDFILERLLRLDPRSRAVDPRRPEGWPEVFTTAYRAWPMAWLPQREGSDGQRLLHNLSFMVGQPHSIDRLHPSLRNDDVDFYFGPMHLGLYLHAAQCVRRGYMAPFDVPDVIDRARIAPVHRDGAPPAVEPPAGDLDPRHFRNKNIALIGAGQSRLWHRDAIDLMYDWLRGFRRDAGVRHTKRVFADYGLQELFWGAGADEVYQAIVDALP